MYTSALWVLNMLTNIISHKSVNNKKNKSNINIQEYRYTHNNTFVCPSKIRFTRIGPNSQQTDKMIKTVFAQNTYKCRLFFLIIHSTRTVKPRDVPIRISRIIQIHFAV